MTKPKVEQKTAGQIVAEALKANKKPDAEQLRSAMERKLPPGTRVSVTLKGAWQDET